MTKFRKAYLFATFAILYMACVSPIFSAETKGVKVEKTAYGGWQNCIRMTNGVVEIIATTDVGPRIMRYGFVGKENEFFEQKENMGKTNLKDWVPFGGHRLWIAPEEKPKTYFPDSHKINYEIKGNTLVLRQPVEPINGIQKEMIITMDPIGTHVGIVHKLTNKNKKSVELAPWSLTMMEKGGKAIFPQEKFVPHPDSPEALKTEGKIDNKSYLPVRTLALWSYTDLSDKRFTFTKKYLILRQDPSNKTPTKIGMSNRQGWGAYARNGHLFVKKSAYIEKGKYPDMGSSFESFTNQDMLEMETLGPLVTLRPEASVIHREDWYLFDGVNPTDTDESIDEQVLPKVK